VSGTTAWRRIQRTEDENIVVGTLAVFKPPSRVRVLMLDAKHFAIRRKPFTLYVAFDAEAMRPLAWIFLPRYELRDGYDHLLGYLNRKKVRIPSVVSDWGAGIRASVSDHLPHAVHQHCAFHVLADVLRKLGGKRFLQPEEGKQLWKKIRHVAIGCDTQTEAYRLLWRLKKQYPEHLRALGQLDRHLESMYQFMKYTPLKHHRTSNRMENFMGVLEQRLKSFRTMKTPDTCIKIISSLIEFKYKKPTKK
jgi:transposase-like protein